MTGCDGYSHYPDLDMAAPREVDVHDIVLEVTGYGIDDHQWLAPHHDDHG